MNFILIRGAALLVAIVAFTGVAQKATRIESQPTPSRSTAAVAETAADPTSAADSRSSTSAFYTVRRDLRRCASPMCGGFFVKQVNVASTRCLNGKQATECYVARIDWNGQTEVEDAKALLRGTITSQRYQRGNFGVLTVTESWQAAGANQASGDFFRVRDRGVRCVVAPCPTHHEAKLNTTVSKNIAGVDLSGANADESAIGEASSAMTGQAGVLVAGSHTSVTGPAGKSQSLKATQFYLRAGKTEADKPKPTKPCIKTGCSKQICSDHTVMTTCEWREEYACYQKASCERQADGNCGFTKTPELTACLTRH